MTAFTLADALRSHRLHDDLLELKISPTRAALDATLTVWRMGLLTDGMCVATFRQILAAHGKQAAVAMYCTGKIHLEQLSRLFLQHAQWRAA
jgi:hypothetical protein